MSNNKDFWEQQRDRLEKINVNDEMTPREFCNACQAARPFPNDYKMFLTPGRGIQYVKAFTPELEPRETDTIFGNKNTIKIADTAKNINARVWHEAEKAEANIGRHNSKATRVDVFELKEPHEKIEAVHGKTGCEGVVVVCTEDHTGKILMPVDQISYDMKQPQPIHAWVGEHCTNREAQDRCNKMEEEAKIVFKHSVEWKASETTDGIYDLWIDKHPYIHDANIKLYNDPEEYRQYVEHQVTALSTLPREINVDDVILNGPYDHEDEKDKKIAEVMEKESERKPIINVEDIGKDDAKTENEL